MLGIVTTSLLTGLWMVLLFWPVTPEDILTPGAAKQSGEAVRRASWTLGLRLYRALRNDGARNPLFSPLMLASSLGALGSVAKGETADQFLRLLNASSLPPSDQDQALKDFLGGNGTSFKLLSSSALFTKQASVLGSGFLKETQELFGLEHVELGPGDSQACREFLQTWASRGMGEADGAELTGKVEAKPGAMILANALNFKGLWDRGFTVESDPRSFLGTTYTKVPTMHRAGLYRHYEDMENMVQVLELGLWQGRASLLLLLPFHVESLSRLDRILTQELLGKWLERLTEESMAISLPRTKLTSALNLQKHLSTLGLSDAWEENKADFSGVTGQPAGRGQLHLGGVLHWASLDLSPESGIREEEIEDEHVEKPKLFYADHSFIIMVKDNATDALLLLGALDHTQGPALHDEL